MICIHDIASSRTVVLWFYNLVFDHNATDPVVQKSCNLQHRFSAHYKVVFLHFQALFNQIFFIP
jgi:hypothetical protein